MTTQLEITFKRCHTCRDLLPTSSFHNSSRTSDGLYGRCKECVRKLNAEQYDKHRERNRARASKYRAENLEKANAAGRAYYWANRERKQSAHREWLKMNQEAVREYRARNADRRREVDAAWRASNKAIVNENASRRRARIRRNGVYEIARKDLLRLAASPCAYCGAMDDIQLDHIIPVARGGQHSIGNLQPLCRGCNLRKMDRLPVEFRYGRTARRGGRS